MTKRLERQRATALRKQGLSYSEIRAIVPVAKSSLSLWLRKVDLDGSQRLHLAAKRTSAGRRQGEKNRRRRLREIRGILASARDETNHFFARGEPLWFVATALYWAEGSKVKAWNTSESVAVTNMDPAVVLLIRNWLRRYCGVPEADLDYSLYIHPDANIVEAQRYWVRKLRIPPSSLRTYMKTHNPSPRRNNTGESYHGTMKMRVRRSSSLNHRISGWIQTVAERCGVV